MRVIGIDPDVQASGVAICENGKLKELRSMRITELVPLMSQHADGEGAHFVIEDVNLVKPTFFRAGAKGQAVKNNISQKVGMVKALGKVLVEFLEHYNCSFELKSPLKAAGKRTKKDAEYFNRITGWTGKSNADTRDAAMLIFKYLEQ